MKIYAKTGKELVKNVQIGSLVKSNLFFGDENFRMIYKIENNKFYIFPEYKNDIEFFFGKWNAIMSLRSALDDNKMKKIMIKNGFEFIENICEGDLMQSRWFGDNCLRIVTKIVRTNMNKFYYVHYYPKSYGKYVLNIFNSTVPWEASPWTFYKF